MMAPTPLRASSEPILCYMHPRSNARMTVPCTCVLAERMYCRAPAAASAHRASTTLTPYLLYEWPGIHVAETAAHTLAQSQAGKYFDDVFPWPCFCTWFCAGSHHGPVSIGPSMPVLMMGK